MLVIIDTFNTSGMTVQLKTKNAQAKKGWIENNLNFSKRKPISIETHDGKEFVNKMFIVLSKKVKVENIVATHYKNSIR